MLHILGNLNPQNRARTLQLTAEKIRHPQQKYLPFTIRFVNDRILLVEIAIRLRQLEGVPRHVGRLLFDRAQVTEWAAERGLAARAGFLAPEKSALTPHLRVGPLLRTGGI